jgi:hypothetical protein
LPVELERVDVWLDDERFFAPFVALFDPRFGTASAKPARSGSSMSAEALGFFAPPT